MVSHELFQKSFLLQKIFEKMKLKDVTNKKTRKADIFELVWLRSVYPTAEASSEVCIPPPSQAPQCASYRGVKLGGVHHTTESRDKNF